MFGLIGHSTSFDAARALAERLDYPEYAAGDLDMWCSAPPQLVERFEVVSATGQRIEPGCDVGAGQALQHCANQSIARAEVVVHRGQVHPCTTGNLP